MKIAVLIPTLNEASNIKKVTNVIDQSLNEFFPNIQTCIINYDSHSTDETRKIFLNCNTLNPKYSFDSGNRGKGYNVISFFNFCIKNNIDFGATIDADITSINTSWLEKMFLPLFDDVDYVTPIYKRSKYDGNLTNQLVFPIISMYSKNIIRQPIGGEFAFNKKFMKLFLEQYNDFALNYGIDICMTLCAINNNLKIKSVELGKKIHRSGINNMKSMFEEVSIALFNNINYKKMLDLNVINEISFSDFSFVNDVYTKKKEGNKLKEEAIINLQKYKYDSIMRKLNITNFSLITKEKWIDILVYFLQKEGKISKQEYDILTNLFIIRTVTFWNEIQSKKTLDAEKNIFDYVYLLKERLWENEKYFKNK